MFRTLQAVKFGQIRFRRGIDVLWKLEQQVKYHSITLSTTAGLDDEMVHWLTKNGWELSCPKNQHVKIPMATSNLGHCNTRGIRPGIILSGNCTLSKHIYSKHLVNSILSKKWWDPRRNTDEETELWNRTSWKILIL